MGIVTGTVDGRDFALKHHRVGRIMLGVASSRFPLPSPRWARCINPGCLVRDRPSQPSFDCMVILSRERGRVRGRRKPISLAHTLSDPSIRFIGEECQVCEGFAGIKAGPRKAGGRAHERSIMVFAALAQLQSSSKSTMRSVGKLAVRQSPYQAIIKVLAAATRRSSRPGCAAELGTPQSP